MKLILKNSEILFKTKSYQELTPVSVLNQPTSYYVMKTGAAISSGIIGGGTQLYVNVYQVTEGTTYYVKSTNVNPNPSSGLTDAVGIAFGTNLLEGPGNISNPILIKSYFIKDTELGDFNISFTPSQDGYIYITEVDESKKEKP